MTVSAATEDALAVVAAIGFKNVRRLPSKS
jgi:hypothetical protein